MPYIGAGIQELNTANSLTVNGDASVTGTVNPSGDTASGDAAAVGFTSAEGLILTGQGSTNDVTIKNDADADVLEIPTGTTNVTVAGNLGVGGTVTGTGTSVFASLDISGDIDVDGTTNLDAVDIDGNVDIATTATLTCGAITSSISDHTNLTLTSTNADANAGPKIALVRDSGSPADSDLTGEILFKADDDAGNSTTFASISSQIGDASNGTEDGALQIKAISNGSLVSRADFLVSETVFNNNGIDMDFRVESNSNANMLFVDAANDRVGIGTNSPAVGTTLDVSGNGGGAAVVSRIRNIGGAAGDDATLELSIATASEEMRILFTDSSGTAGQIVVDGGDNSMAFSSGTSERMRILSTGEICMNDTARILACVQHLAFDGANEQGLCIENTVNNSSGAAIRFIDHAGNQSGGGIYFSDSNNINYATSSDVRLKENVADMTGSIDRVKALAPKRFNFISNPDTTVDGFLAHEAQTVVPEAVIGTHNEVETWTQREINDGDAPDGTSAGDNKLDEDDNTIPKMQGIDHSKLVPLLTGALKEAIAKIETLETEMTALKARVTTLEGE